MMFSNTTRFVKTVIDKSAEIESKIEAIKTKLVRLKALKKED